MNLKEFLKEEKEERKERRRVQKESKKHKYSGEEKKYRIFGIIFTILIIVGLFFYTCRGTGSFEVDWSSIVGLSDEMIDALEQPTDLEKVFPYGTLNPEDMSSCNEILLENGIDLSKDDDNIVVKNSFELNSKQAGALSKEFIQKVHKNIKLMDFFIFNIGEDFYQRSVVYLDLSAFYIDSNLPYIYVTNTSKIQVLDNKIIVLNDEVKINSIEDKMNESIVEVLNGTSNKSIINYCNKLVDGVINNFAKVINCNIEISANLIKFKV